MTSDAEKVRLAKAILTIRLSPADVARMLDVAPITLKQYAVEPGVNSHRPIPADRLALLVSLAGAAIDYLVMAFAPHLWMLVLGRAIAGVTSIEEVLKVCATLVDDEVIA